ncbi:hypothetical protein I4I73_20470 [Pseudonocardia sp. KRD-184]|uniref:hypothetical protein n=1 Tax=Pseudonocardia oceani TaxID=2792013 RepID=UPI001C4A289E|nr:hypothetical protein [Pseudonocardia oceani]MBW0091259.1 hypothetical protein [Pseudonocardia oceani]MBW0098364.1 hypothetical protein [Pseudonocardia oceani]
MDIDDARLLTRRELLAHGFDDTEIRARRRRGELCRVRRGACARPGALPGRPVWGGPLRRVQLTRSRRSGARCTADLHVHAAPLEPWEITWVDGVAVTSLARTLADVGRHLGFEQAVVVADAALWRELVTRAELDEALDAARGRPGVPAARRAPGFARWGAESVGESRGRVAMLRAGLPEPVLQWAVRTATGVVPAGRTSGDVVYAEKRREDAMRGEGPGAVRWCWADLDPFDVTATRLRRTFRA